MGLRSKKISDLSLSATKELIAWYKYSEVKRTSSCYTETQKKPGRKRPG